MLSWSVWPNMEMYDQTRAIQGEECVMGPQGALGHREGPQSLDWGGGQGENLRERRFLAKPRRMERS